MELEEPQSIHKCDCGRPWCEYFAPGVGDGGVSYTKTQLESLRDELDKLKKHIDKVLKD